VFLLLIQLLMLFFPFDYFLKPAYIFFIHDCFFKARFASRVSLPEFRFPSFASRVSLREHEVLFASLKKTNYSLFQRFPSFASGARGPFRFARSSGLIHKDNFPESFRVSSGWNPE